MNILFTIDDLAPEAGGPSRTLPAVCVALARLGHRVEIVCHGPHRGWSAPLLPDPTLVQTTVVKRGKPGLLQALGRSAFRKAVEERAREMKADVIHDNGIWSPANHATALAARALGVPRLVAVRGMLRPWALGRKRVKKLVGWVAYQKKDLSSARCLVATSVDEAAEIDPLRLGIPVAMVRHGVDPRPLRVPRPATGPRTALFVGRLVPNKGLADLVEAWSRVRPQGWTVRIAGPDDEGHGAQIRELASKAGIAADFEFLGALDEDAKWRALEQVDLFVLPTWGENFGLAIAEALAAGVPVITTKGAPWPEIAERKCGWWVDRGAGPLAEALKAAVESGAEERESMGRRGRDLVRDRYGWPSIAADLVLLYAWAAGDGPKPDFVREPQREAAK